MHLISAISVNKPSSSLTVSSINFVQPNIFDQNFLLSLRNHQVSAPVALSCKSQTAFLWRKEVVLIRPKLRCPTMGREPTKMLKYDEAAVWLREHVKEGD